MIRLYKNFIKSFRLLSNWKYLGLAILSDFLFVIAIVTIWFFISNKLIESYDILQEMVNSINPGVIGDSASLDILSGQMGVINSTINNIFLSLIILVLLVFLSFIIFNGFSWLIIKFIVNKEKFVLKLKYFLKFCGLTSFWLLFLLLLLYLVFQGISDNMAIMEKTILNWFVIGYLTILFYFAMLSYAYLLKDEKFWKSLGHAFLEGIRRIYIFVPLFVIIMVVFLVLSLLFSIFINLPFFFIIPIITFLVLCIWARIYLLLVVKEL